MDKPGKDEDEKKLRAQMAKSAEDMRKMVDTKSLGLPECFKQQIREFTEQILYDVFDEESVQAQQIFDFITVPKAPTESFSRSMMGPVDVEKRGKEIIQLGRKSREILDLLKTAKNKTGDNVEVPGAGSAANEHLEKMVKQLHCRHRKLIRLAEEIVAKRWKLSALTTVNDGKQLKGENGAPNAGKFTDKKRRSKNRRRKQKQSKKRKKRSKAEELKTLYTNPMAKLQDVRKRCGTGQDTWKQDDPLLQVLNKVGVEKAEKCLLQSEEEGFFSQRPTYGKAVNLRKNVEAFPDPLKPTFEAHIGKSALTIFVSNYSKMTVVPRTSSVTGKKHFRDSLLTLKVDQSTLTNDFVDMWKRRTYSVGIILIILTALLQCAYLCGPRMGDNYVTYAMTEAISGMPWAIPTGVYGLIFLGYLFGGMAVIKTAAAVEHNQTVKEYVKKRKWKFYWWYGLALYYLCVWIFRSYLWYSKLQSTDREIHAIFQKKFYYNQLPSRLLYTQFLLMCCGANGPGDYLEGPKIGWPKSCYQKVNSYDEYYEEPKPIDYGCSMRFYKYTTTTMTAMAILLLLIWLLILIYPIYLYVYELFIVMKSKEPEPWLVELPY